MQTTYEQVLSALREGEPAIFPTDTVYGVGVSVRHAQGLQALYDLKQREAGKPIAWLVDSPAALDVYGRNIPDYARALVAQHWPGALTVVINANSQAPQAFCSPEGTVALRMPAGETALRLIAELGAPIATTSVNLSGDDPATTFASIDQDVFGQVPALCADAEIQSAVASTVVDCTGPEPVVLRQGSIALSSV